MNIFTASSSSRKTAHIIIRILAIVLIPFVGLVPIDLLYIFLAYLFYYTIGHGIMFHRYYSHNSFEFKNKIVKWFFILTSITSVRGSPIGWVYLHKLHHANVDSIDDPHSPHYKKFNILKISEYNQLTDNINPLKIRHLLNKETVFINKYYWLICLSVPIVLILIDLHLFYVMWLLPICLFEFLSTFFNYANHIDMPGSYKTYGTKSTGESTNNLILWLFSLGEAWHNNHHYNPKNYNFKNHWWEFDPGALIIRLIKI